MYLAHGFKAGYSKVVQLFPEIGAEIPRGAMVEPTEQLCRAFDQGQKGIRQTLFETIRSAPVS